MKQSKQRNPLANNHEAAAPGDRATEPGTPFAPTRPAGARFHECVNCKGTGEVEDGDCPECDGTGEWFE
jgi:hypothetical protein